MLALIPKVKLSLSQCPPYLSVLINHSYTSNNDFLIALVLTIVDISLIVLKGEGLSVALLKWSSASLQFLSTAFASFMM